jgi:hypothetical protein
VPIGLSVLICKLYVSTRVNDWIFNVYDVANTLNENRSLLVLSPAMICRFFRILGSSASVKDPNFDMTK